MMSDMEYIYANYYKDPKIKITKRNLSRIKKSHSCFGNRFDYDKAMGLKFNYNTNNQWPIKERKDCRGCHSTQDKTMKLMMMIYHNITVTRDVQFIIFDYIDLGFTPFLKNKTYIPLPIGHISNTKKKGLSRKRLETISSCVKCLVPHPTWRSVTGLPDIPLKIICGYINWVKPLHLSLYQKVIHTTRRRIHTVCLSCYQSIPQDTDIKCPEKDCEYIIDVDRVCINHGQTGRTETRHQERVTQRKKKRRY
jgi:hypothetical protein